MSRVFTRGSGRSRSGGPPRRSPRLAIAKAALLLAIALLASALPPAGATAGPDPADDFVRWAAAPAPPVASEAPTARFGWLPRGDTALAFHARPLPAAATLRVRRNASTAPAPRIARWTLSHATSTSLP